MNKNKFTELYHNRIVPIGKNPVNFMKAESAGHNISAINPLCGDKFQLALNFQNNKALDCSFYGFGCILSKASTSILLKEIEGKSVDQIHSLCKNFLDGLKNPTKHEQSNSDIDLLLSLIPLDGRIDCIKLSWENLYEYLSTTIVH